MIHKIAFVFNAGGPFMWVILSVLAIAVAIMLERLIFYFITCRGNGGLMVSDIIKELNNGNSEGAHKIISGNTSPRNILMSVVLEGIERNMSNEHIEEGVEEAAINEMPRMTQRLNYLSLFANIATLLGLIGTISGLQSSFASLASVEASKKATMLAAGIAEAMNCTAFGLIVAVPCMVAYTFFYNKQQRLTKDIDQSIVRLMNYIKKKGVKEIDV